jgi:hypothetical protein
VKTGDVLPVWNKIWHCEKRIHENTIRLSDHGAHTIGIFKKTRSRAQAAQLFLRVTKEWKGENKQRELVGVPWGGWTVGGRRGETPAPRQTSTSITRPVFDGLHMILNEKPRHAKHSLLTHQEVDGVLATSRGIVRFSIKYSTRYANHKFRTYNVNGWPAGLYKNASKFSYLRVFGADHEVPAYKWRGEHRGTAALQMFEQTSTSSARKVQFRGRHGRPDGRVYMRECVESICNKRVDLAESGRRADMDSFCTKDLVMHKY